MPTVSESLNARDVEAALDKIRPALRLDGGGVRLVGVEGNDICMEMLGACTKCSSLEMTKLYGIEAALRRNFQTLGTIRWSEPSRVRGPEAASDPSGP